MKVLIVSQYYPPEAVPLPADLAQCLAERGHSVRVLTGYPNYPRGKIFPGYRQRWRGREAHGGIQVWRVPLFADHSQSVVKRLLNYASFAVTAAAARRVSWGVDVVYVYATQMTAAYGPWLWRLTGGAPYVLHVQDLWPDSIIDSTLVRGSMRGKMIAGALQRWLGSVYSRASAVIGIAPTMVSTLIERGVPAERAHLVYNWADASNPGESVLSKHHSAPTFVVYAGNIGVMQDLDTAVRAAHAAADVGLVLTIVGDGIVRETLRQLVTDLGATNVRFQEPVPREHMPEVYAQADYALVPLKKVQAFRGTIPSKFQSALAAGLPIITTVQGDVRALVENLEVGFTADAESVSSLEAALRNAAQQSATDQRKMATRAKHVYNDLFTKESSISRIEGILSASAGRKDGEL